MMRIAIAFEFPTLSGGEQSMLAVVDRLLSATPHGDFQFVAIAPERGRLADALASRGMHHIPLELRDAAGARLPRDVVCRNLISAVIQAAPDLLHANSLSMGRLTGAIAGDLPVPCAAHLRDILGLSRAAVADLNRNRRLVAVSHATKDFHAAQGLAAERTSVIYNGLDCERFAPRPSTAWLKAELQLPRDSFLAATIGQIGLRKGQDVLAAAAAVVGHQAPNLHFLLVGERLSSKAESLAFERDLADRFRAAGLADRLHRLGYRADVDRLLNEIDLLVHPAHQEPLGRVLLEAAAAGVPIVATAVGGTPEIVEDGVSARLIPPNDPAALAAAILELHSRPALRQEFARAARHRVESMFSIERAAAELAALWRTVVDYQDQMSFDK